VTPEQISELRRLMAEATPGPWESAARKDDRAVALVRQYHRTIATVGDGGAGRMTALANGLLIASAVNSLPALLAAAEREAKLRELLEYFIDDHVGNGCADCALVRDARKLLEETP
jgi:hypothetical protein